MIILYALILLWIFRVLIIFFKYKNGVLTKHEFKFLLWHSSVKSLVLNEHQVIGSNTYMLKVIKYFRGIFVIKQLTQITIGSPGALPNILLDSNNKISSLYKEKHAAVANFQRHSFEGDMDKYFSIYTHRDMKIESMQFLTPDILMFFRDKFMDFDILIIGGTLDMRKSGDFKSDDLKKDVSYLVKKIDRIYKYWNSQDKIDSLANVLEK